MPPPPPTPAPVAPSVNVVPPSAVSAAPIPEARTTPGIAVAGGTGFLGAYAGTIKFLWPMSLLGFAPTDADAMNIAIFTMSASALVYHMIASARYKKALMTNGQKP